MWVRIDAMLHRRNSYKFHRSEKHQNPTQLIAKKFRSVALHSTMHPSRDIANFSAKSGDEVDCPLADPGGTSRRIAKRLSLATPQHQLAWQGGVRPGTYQNEEASNPI